MNLDDVQKVTALISEKQAIQAAVQFLAEGGRIVSMMVGPPVSSGLNPPIAATGVPVPTAYITYPPGMVDAIRSAFTARQQQITNELTQLGVTGM